MQTHTHGVADRDRQCMLCCTFCTGRIMPTSLFVCSLCRASPTGRGSRCCAPAQNKGCGKLSLSNINRAPGSRKHLWNLCSATTKSPSESLPILPTTYHHHAWTQPSQVGKWLTLLCHHPHHRINPILCRRHLILPFWPDYYHLNQSRLC